MVDGKSETSGAAGGTGAQGESTLGRLLTEARKSGGYTAEQVAAGTHIPAHYIKAIETDDYGMISDQLYLLPFLRKYAAFIGLDPEDVASRFVREVQKAEISATKASEPIPMISNERKPSRARYLIAVLIVLGIVALVAAVIVKRQVLLQRVLHLSKAAAPGIEAPLQAQPSPATKGASSDSSVPFQSSVAPAASSDAPTTSAPVEPLSDDSQN